MSDEKKPTRGTKEGKRAPSAEEIDTAIMAAEGLADRFTDYAKVLRRAKEDPTYAVRQSGLSGWLEEIHGAERAVARIGGSK